MHAQDRFFEMDLRRHITAGRLSELVGEGGLETDRVIRTLGWRRVAEAELPTLKPETRRYLQAYADGVNAYIKQQGTRPRCRSSTSCSARRCTDYRVEDWTPADSLAWLKAMAWDLRGDYSAELMRARLAGSMSINQIDELYPPYDYGTTSRSCPPRTGQPSAVHAASRLPCQPAARPVARRGRGRATAPPRRPRAPWRPADETLRRKRAYAVVQRALDAVPVHDGSR